MSFAPGSLLAYGGTGLVPVVWELESGPSPNESLRDVDLVLVLSVTEGQVKEPGYVLALAAGRVGYVSVTRLLEVR